MARRGKEHVYTRFYSVKSALPQLHNNLANCQFVETLFHYSELRRLLVHDSSLIYTQYEGVLQTNTRTCGPKVVKYLVWRVHTVLTHTHTRSVSVHTGFQVSASPPLVDFTVFVHQTLESTWGFNLFILYEYQIQFLENFKLTWKNIFLNWINQIIETISFWLQTNVYVIRRWKEPLTEHEAEGQASLKTHLYI